jgi:hypothetical protein
VIQGDAAGERAGFGGQVMAMKGATVRVRGVTLYRWASAASCALPDPLPHDGQRAGLLPP